MKTRFLKLLFIFPLVLFNCNNDDLTLTSRSIEGRVISEVTSEGISDAELLLKVKRTHGSDNLTWTGTVNNQTIMTNEDGYFKTIIYYEEEDNFTEFIKQNTDDHTGFTAKRFLIFNLDSIQPITFRVRFYNPLQILVKNTQPFNDNDSISISIFQMETNYLNSIIYDIENFGDINEIWGPPASDNGNRPYWIGSNVDSIIYGHLQEGTNYVVKWSVIRNGMSEEFESEVFSTLSDELNTFAIEY